MGKDDRGTAIVVVVDRADEMTEVRLDEVEALTVDACEPAVMGTCTDVMAASDNDADCDWPVMDGSCMLCSEWWLVGAWAWAAPWPVPVNCAILQVELADILAMAAHSASLVSVL